MAHRLAQALLILLCLLLSASALAAIEVREFDSPVQKQRYDSLNGSLRCPKCQNQAIGDSDSPIAGDMRERVYQLLQDGRSDIEIQNYMIDRFGDYVLYNPRLSGRTWLLWGLPAGLVVLGAAVSACAGGPDGGGVCSGELPERPERRGVRCGAVISSPSLAVRPASARPRWPSR